MQHPFLPSRRAIQSAVLRALACLALAWTLALPQSAEAQIVVQHSGQQPQQAQRAPAQAQPQRQARSPRRLKLAIAGELGWRWVALGQSRIPRDDDAFSMAYHGALRLDLGGARGGLYTYARFDGYAPTGRGTFPWSSQVRVGYFRNVHYFDLGGPRSSTSTSCGYAYCVARTTSWWEPAGWVNGLRYFYAAGHLMGGTEVTRTTTDTQLAGALGIGLGMVETKFSTWFWETELLFYPDRQWQDGRSQWGWYFRGGSIFGPIFVDVTVLLDPAVGGELSVGLGAMIGG